MFVSVRNYVNVIRRSHEGSSVKTPRVPTRASGGRKLEKIRSLNDFGEFLARTFGVRGHECK